MRVPADHQIAPGVDGRMGQIHLARFGRMVAFDTPVEVAHHELTAFLAQLLHRGCHLTLGIDIGAQVANAEQAHLDAVDVVGGRAVEAEVRDTGRIERIDRVGVALRAEIMAMVVGHAHRFDAAVGEDLRVFRRTLEVERFFLNVGARGEGALAVAHRELVGARVG